MTFRQDVAEICGAILGGLPRTSIFCSVSPDQLGCGNVQSVHRVSLEEAYDDWAADLVKYAAVLVPPQDAADLVADAFTSLLAQPNATWAAARDPRRFLFGVVANTARQHHRSTHRRRARQERAKPARHPSGHSLSSPAIDVVLEHPEIARSLDGLSVQQRAVVYLSYWEDMTAGDVAQTLHVSTGTVRKQLARARAHLRKELS